MTNSDRHDAATGMLNRKAFLEQVHEAHRLMPQSMRRGCLLIMYFPLVRSLSNDSSRIDIQNEEKSETPKDAVDDAVCHLLAIVETRLRSRDTIGRIARHSMCILLKGCREADAVVVADQFAALLRDIVVQAGDRQLPMDMHYRIVPLDGRGSRRRQGVSRLVVAPALQDHPRLSKQLTIAGNIVDLSSSKVVSLNGARIEKGVASSAEQHPVIASAAASTVMKIGTRNHAQSWRLRPGMLVQRKPLICCFRLQPMAIVKMETVLQNSDLFVSMLTALGLGERETRPTIESQLILPVKASQIDDQLPQWLASRCKQMRVAPSDVCLSTSVESISAVLQSVAPVLRQLNQNGIRLMLEGTGSSNQFHMMKNVAQFDYLYISGRTLSDSLSNVATRAELESIIAVAQEQQCEICAGGIDTQIMLNHAATMKIDIGFGRQCGASIAFPDEAWMSS